MAFTREPTVTRIPQTVDHITVILQTDAAGGESIKGQFEIMFSDGTTKTIQHPLVSELTAQQITQLRAFMANIRTRANAEILGG